MALTKIILVGQAPGAKNEPFDQSAGRRLAALAGLDHTAFLDRFERVNLADAPLQGEMAVRAARERADKLRAKWRGRKVVLLGRGVAAAFRLVPDDYSWFKPIEVPPGVEVAVMPHPSGISHWWNELENVEAAREFMLRLKLGFFETPKRRSHEQFDVAQVAAALEAGRGVYTWAAEALAEATGRSVTAQTVKNYVDRYPDILANVGRSAQVRFFGGAVKNVVKAVEAGDVDTSKWALTTKMAHEVADELGGIRFERMISAKVDGRVAHQHAHLHLHSIDKVRGKLTDDEVDVLDGIYERLAEEAPAALEAPDAAGAGERTA